MASSKASLPLIVILGILTLQVHPALAAQHPSYAGFALPEMNFTLGERNFSFETQDSTGTLGINASDTAIYLYAYVSYDGGAWSPVTLSGNSLGAVWLTGNATASIQVRPVNFTLSQSRLTTRRNFVVTYSCSRTVQETWDCHDGWQIWQFNASLQTQSPAASCSDGVQNGEETGIDCGGTCPACPTCSDGLMNGDETGTDCGGDICSPCSQTPSAVYSVMGTNPANGFNSPSRSVTFDLKAYGDAGIDTIKLFGNWSGQWTANYTGVSYANDTWMNVTVSGIRDGRYAWGVFANDSYGNSDWSDSNRTLTVDTTAPYFTSLANQTGYAGHALSYDVNASDAGVGIASYSIDDTTNFAINPSTGVIANIVSMVERYYVVNVSVRDSLGNLNWSLWSYDVSAYDSSLPEVVAITASSGTPANIMDHNFDTSWSVYQMGAWIQFEFAEPTDLDGIAMSFVAGDSRNYYFTISVSNDSQSWTQVYSGQSSGTLASGFMESTFFDMRTARYLRIVGNSNSYNSGNVYSEIWFAPPRSTLSSAVSHDEPMRILFLGNSFTSMGYVPYIVGNLASSALWPTPNVSYNALGGQSLSGHRVNAVSLALVDQGDWDFVVLQDLSTRGLDPPLGDPDGLNWDVAWFYDRIKATSPDAKIVLYETWATTANQELLYSTWLQEYIDEYIATQAVISGSYEEAAYVYVPAHVNSTPATDIIVAPAGDAWAEHISSPDSFRLHLLNDHHADVPGRYLSSLAIYSTIYQMEVSGVDWWWAMSSGDAMHLRAVVDRVVEYP